MLLNRETKTNTVICLSHLAYTGNDKALCSFIIGILIMSIRFKEAYADPLGFFLKVIAILVS